MDMYRPSYFLNFIIREDFMFQLFQSFLGTEDAFLCYWFALLLIALVVILGAVIYLFYRAKWKLHQIYGVSVLSVGLLFMLALPPLSAPDEILHFTGAYALSNQLMGQPVRDAEGNVRIRQEDEYLVNWPGDHDPCKATVLGQTLDRSVYEAMHEKGLFHATEEGSSITLQQPVKTTPCAYLLPALGITLARLLHLSAIGLVLLGRFMNLLLFTALGSLAVRRTPIGKEVFFAISLFPMTLELAGSYSYDSYIMALSFYLLAVILDLALARPRAEISWKNVLELSLLALLLSPCKMIYATLFLLCFLIPVRKWGTKPWPKWLLSVALIGLLIVGSILLVNVRELLRYVNASGVTQAPELTSAGEVNTVKLHDLSELLQDRTLVFRIIRNTLGILGGQFLGTTVGMWLGAFDRGLVTPFPCLVLFWGGTLTLAVVGRKEEPTLTRGRRAWMILVFLLLSFVLMVSMLLAYTPADTFYILGVQGRYFLPYLPVLLLAFRVTQLDRFRYIFHGKVQLHGILLSLMMGMDAYILLRCFITVVQRV